jgi:hypothetical protein
MSGNIKLLMNMVLVMSHVLMECILIIQIEHVSIVVQKDIMKIQCPIVVWKKVIVEDQDLVQMDNYMMVQCV